MLAYGQGTSININNDSSAINGYGSTWIDGDDNYHYSVNTLNTIAINADKLEHIGTRISWQEPESVLDEKILEKIREEISKALVENDPIKQLKDIEIPPMPGFVEI